MPANNFIRYNDGTKYIEYDSSVAKDGSGPWILLPITAAQITEGTFPSGVNGSNLSNLNASNLASGVVPDARFPTTLPPTGSAQLRDTDDSHVLQIIAGSNLSGNRTLTIITGDNSYTLTLAGNATISGVNTGDAGSVLYQTGTPVGNVGTGEDTLWSQSVAANTLHTNGMSIWGDASGTFAANSANKTVRVKFGSTTIMTLAYSPGSTATQHWIIKFKIKRLTSTTQTAVASMIAAPTDAGGVTSEVGVASPAETLTNAINFIITGEATNNDDIVLREATIRLDDAP